MLHYSPGVSDKIAVSNNDVVPFDAVAPGGQNGASADVLPRAIVLTHCHFDHVGAIEDLAEEWDVPVYAHELELPYITGAAKYPPPNRLSAAVVWPLYPEGQST